MIPKTLISVSNNLSKMQVIQPPIFHQKHFLSSKSKSSSEEAVESRRYSSNRQVQECIQEVDESSVTSIQDQYPIFDNKSSQNTEEGHRRTRWKEEKDYSEIEKDTIRQGEQQVCIHSDLKLNDNINQHVFWDENMKTKKNYDEMYIKHHKGTKLIRKCPKPEYIEDYDRTERIPIPTDSTTAKWSDYKKYADKYSITKKWKLYQKLHRPKASVVEIRPEGDSLEEKFQDLKRKKHRRVVSQNLQCAKIIAKRLSSTKEYPSPPRDKSAKSTERGYYRATHEESKSRLRSKRTSCHNSLESSTSHLSLTMSKSILSSREKLIKYIKLSWKATSKIPSTTVDFYKIVKLIGKGAFGKVTLGVHKLSGKQVAIKMIEKSYIQDAFSRRKVFQEVYILKKIRHSNIIRLLEVFESESHLLMVMEYAGGGDLLQYVKTRGRLSENEARKYFRQILYGLGHCHWRSVLHRDIKLDNILLGKGGTVKICDFGVSKIVKPKQKIYEQWGTPAYIAPEIIADNGYEGYYVDIWSLGVLLYAMVWGAVPFKAGNMQELYHNIMGKGFSFPVPLSKQVKDLIRKMLNKVPENRILIPEILEHPWVVNDWDFDIEYEESDYESSRLLSEHSDMDSQINQSDSLSENNDSISGITHENINYINVDNLFWNNKFDSKLNYNDYKSLTEDFATMHIDENALSVIEGFGYPKSMVKKSINRGDMNHATTCYTLLKSQDIN
jgi:serine/threonine protein kinase